MPQSTFFTLILSASIAVKIVLAVLLLASIISWTIIFQRAVFLKQTKKVTKQFENAHLSTSSLQQLFERVQQHKALQCGLGQIFYDGFQAFLACQNTHPHDKQIRRQVNLAMRAAHTKAIQALEKNLSLLATIASNAVYVGLLGTVFGVMNAFEGLSASTQASIATVGPGIAQALITTAMGLIVAIPAVVSYNLFHSTVLSIDNDYLVFQDLCLARISKEIA